MPYDITFWDRERVAVVRAYGVGNIEEGHRALRDVQSHCDFERAAALLIDIRDLTYPATIQDVRRFARTYATQFPVHPIAFLTPPGVMFGLARATEELAALQGATVMTFQDQEEALEWLRVATTTPR
jgi:hypothetical protein